MLYYLMLVPAVLSTAVIYFLSPALSYWWLLPVLLGCFVAANLVYVLLMFVCSLFAGPNRMYDRISPFYLALTLALDGWILALCRIKIHVEGLEKVPTDSEFLFVSNHRSNFDPMVQWWVLRRWPSCPSRRICASSSSARSCAGAAFCRSTAKTRATP